MMSHSRSYGTEVMIVTRDIIHCASGMAIYLPHEAASRVACVTDVCQ